jgi:hypothetical protein
MITWPDRGTAFTFYCVACESPIHAQYQLQGRLLCECGTPSLMPPLSPGETFTERL